MQNMWRCSKRQANCWIKVLFRAWREALRMENHVELDKLGWERWVKDIVISLVIQTLNGEIYRKVLLRNKNHQLYVLEYCCPPPLQRMLAISMSGYSTALLPSSLYLLSVGTKTS